MEHKRVEQLRSVADVAYQPPKEVLTRRERLERWVELLEADPRRRLYSLGDIEFQPRETRHLMRADDSPLTVAYNDPVLRGQGLETDRLGDGVAFFGLSEGDAHRILCSCLNGRTMEASTAARRVRASINQRGQKMLALGITTGLVLAVPAMALLVG
jgi:type IV secretory pathway VirJ component